MRKGTKIQRFKDSKIQRLKDYIVHNIDVLKLVTYIWEKKRIEWKSV
jgi:hypothetical protein